MQPYTRIENSFLNSLCKLQLSGSEFRVLLLVIRYTKGFNRDSAVLSLSFIGDATELNKRTTQRALEKLEALGLIILTHTDGTKTRRITLKGDILTTCRGDKLTTCTGDILTTQEIKEIKKRDCADSTDVERLISIKKSLEEEWRPDEL